MGLVGEAWPGGACWVTCLSSGVCCVACLSSGVCCFTYIDLQSCKQGQQQKSLHELLTI